VESRTDTHLEQFLQGQAEAGEYESSREFSVNLVAAQQKLGRYALPRQTAWLLKFIQSATEYGCPDLGLRLGKERVEVRFPRNALGPLLDLQSRLQALCPANLGEDHLFGGLLALHALGGQVFVEDREQRWYPAQSRDLETLDAPAEYPTVIYIPRHGGFWEQLKARIWYTANLLQELRENCYPCPVELTVDARPLNLGAQDVPLLSGLIKGDPGADLDYYGQLQRETGKKSVTYCLWGSSRPSHIGFAVQLRISPENKESSLSLEWIRSGVVVKRSTANLPGSKRLVARILIPTRGLKFDASGFAIKDDEESRARQAVGATYLEHAVEAVKGELSRQNRWEKFIHQNDSQVTIPKPSILIEQLDGFIELGKHHFSRCR
jgi:hypothetical protein